LRKEIKKKCEKLELIFKLDYLKKFNNIIHPYISKYLTLRFNYMIKIIIDKIDIYKCGQSAGKLINLTPQRLHAELPWRKEEDIVWSHRQLWAF